MPYSFSLINRFQISLVIHLSFRTADIQKESCKIKIFFFSGNSVQFNKTHLNYLVPGIHFNPVIAKIPVDQIG